MNWVQRKEPGKYSHLLGVSLLFLFAAQPGMASHASKAGQQDGKVIPETVMQPGVALSQQQSKVTISGMVSDALGGIAGVNVVEKGTTNGVITDMDGRYTLEVSKGATLQISYIGFITQEIKVDGKTTINVLLEEDTQKLDEVVVVGYGVQKKKDVTGAVMSLGNETLTTQNAVNPTLALKGQVAGLSVQQNNGRAGGESTVILRGQSAIGKTVQPLVIIDGMPADWGYFNQMAAEDIERVDVLKDASSTAIYGSRASGGVVIVTTRDGREQKNKLTYSGSVGFKTQTRAPEMMNAKQFYQFYQDGVDFRGVPEENKINSDELQYLEQGIDTDWTDFITRNGFQTNHNISLAGGNKNETHFLSMGYLKEDGLMKSEGYERYTMNAKITGKMWDKVTIGSSMLASYAVYDQGSKSMLNNAYRLRPWGNPYEDDGSYRFFPTYGETGIVNPVFDLENQTWERKQFRVRGNAFVEYKPIDGLAIKTNFMPRFSYRRTGSYAGEMTQANKGNESDSSSESLWGLGYLWENTVTYNTKIAEDHSLTFTGLFSAENNFDETYYGAVEDLTYEDEYWYNFGASTKVTSLTSKYANTAMLSYMARINYGFKDKYLLTLTGRWDGSSKLAKGNQWGFFPSAALAWRASEEEFIKNLNLFSNLKLRLSYGVAGNNAVDPYSSFATLSSTSYVWDDLAAKGSAAAMSNRALGWEKSYEYNLGIDMGFLDERINGSIELYHKTTKDLILSRKIPSHQGVTSLKQNVGSVRNKGIEVTINTLNIKTNDFSWSTSLNFSANKNEILELYGDKVDDIGNALFIGKPVTVSYDYIFDGIWQLGEEEEALRYGSKPGYVKIRDIDGDGKITPEKDKVVLGNPFPSWTGGMTNTFTYKGFDFSFFIYTRQGVFMKSAYHSELVSDFGGTRYNVANVPYWTPNRPSNQYPAAGAPNNYADKAYYKDCSFWRVGHITLGYDFTSLMTKSVGISNLRAYLQVNNPFVFTKYDGWDPEWADKGCGDTPLNGVTYTLGVNLSF
ncbi:SusC/RagA family TonB-linked outer membrane protein [Parabacteroides johnsonii]